MGQDWETDALNTDEAGWEALLHEWEYFQNHYSNPETPAFASPSALYGTQESDQWHEGHPDEDSPWSRYNYWEGPPELGMWSGKWGGMADQYRHDREEMGFPAYAQGYGVEARPYGPRPWESDRGLADDYSDYVDKYLNQGRKNFDHVGHCERRPENAPNMAV